MWDRRRSEQLGHSLVGVGLGTAYSEDALERRGGKLYKHDGNIAHEQYKHREV